MKIGCPQRRKTNQKKESSNTLSALDQIRKKPSHIKQEGIKKMSVLLIFFSRKETNPHYY